ncbi:unnamed protein product, partial [Arabidopsis halleri]
FFTHFLSSLTLTIATTRSHHPLFSFLSTTDSHKHHLRLSLHFHPSPPNRFCSPPLNNFSHFRYPLP